jgi:hypothetical protein
MHRLGLSLILLVVLGALSGARAEEKQITAREVVADIRKHVGVEWDKNTVDTVNAPVAESPVLGAKVT